MRSKLTGLMERIPDSIFWSTLGFVGTLGCAGLIYGIIKACECP